MYAAIDPAPFPAGTRAGRSGSTLPARTAVVAAARTAPGPVPRSARDGRPGCRSSGRPESSRISAARAGSTDSDDRVRDAGPSFPGSISELPPSRARTLRTLPPLPSSAPVFGGKPRRRARRPMLISPVREERVDLLRVPAAGSASRRPARTRRRSLRGIGRPAVPLVAHEADAQPSVHSLDREGPAGDRRAPVPRCRVRVRGKHHVVEREQGPPPPDGRSNAVESSWSEHLDVAAGIGIGIRSGRAELRPAEPHVLRGDRLAVAPRRLAQAEQPPRMDRNRCRSPSASAQRARARA